MVFNVTYYVELWNKITFYSRVSIFIRKKLNCSDIIEDKRFCLVKYYIIYDIKYHKTILSMYIVKAM